MFMLFIIIYASVFTPLNLCFQYQDFNFYAEMIIEGIFIIDMILYFFTQIVDIEENVINNKYLICINYLKGWFLFDFVTSFPYNLLEYVYIPEDKRYIYSWFFIIKWVKVTRVLRLSKYEFLIDKKVTNSKKKRIMKLIIIFIISIHVSSCFWIYLGNNSPINNNWMSKDLLEKSDADIYIASVYFHLVTVYTVGYGDILCTNQVEMLYNCYLLLVGVLLYSFAVTAFSKLFVDENPRKIEYFNKLDALETMKRDYNLNNILYSSIKRSINIEYEKNYTDRYELLENLPSAVKHKLTDYLYDILIKDLAFFSEKNYGFILFVMPFLKRHKLQRGQTLCEINETLDEMYIVINGCLSLTLGNQYSNIEVGVIKQNYHFGDVLLQTNQKSPFEIISKSKVTEVFVLRKSDFFKIKQEYHGIVYNILQNSLRRLENYNKRKIQYLQLLKFEKSVSKIKNIINKFNVYLMEKGFNDFFYKGKDFEEMNDFITNNEFDIIKKFIILLDRKHKRRSTNFNVLKGLKHLRTMDKSNKNMEINIQQSISNLKSLKDQKSIPRKKSILKINNDLNESTIITPPKIINPYDKKNLVIQNKKINEIQKDQSESNEFLTFGNIQPDSPFKKKSLSTVLNNSNKCRVQFINISENTKEIINTPLKNLEIDKKKEIDISEEKYDNEKNNLESNIKNSHLDDVKLNNNLESNEEMEKNLIPNKGVKRTKISGNRLRNSTIQKMDENQRIYKKFRLKIFEILKFFLGKSGSSDNEVLKKESELNDKILEVINWDFAKNSDKRTNFSTNSKVMKMTENLKNSQKEHKTVSSRCVFEHLTIGNKSIILEKQVQNFNFTAEKKVFKKESNISFTIPQNSSNSKRESLNSHSSNKNLTNIIRTKKNSEQGVKIMNSNYTFNIFMDQNLKDKNKETNTNFDINYIEPGAFSNQSSDWSIENNDNKNNEIIDYFQSNQKLKNILRKIKNILK